MNTKTKQAKKPAKKENAKHTKGKDGLTQLQRLFVNEYVKDSNGTKACIRAGYSESTAAQQATRLLRNVQIKAIIEQLQSDMVKKVQEDTGITLERTLNEIARIAFFDPRRLFQADGSPVSIQELDDETAAVIAGLDVLEEFEGQGKERQFIGNTKKFKLADKKGALDMLMKHLGGYKEDNKQAGEAAAGTVTALLAELGTRNGLKIVKTVPNDDQD